MKDTDFCHQIRWQESQSLTPSQLIEETIANEFSRIKEKFVIDGNVDYPEPEYLIRIGDTPTLPKGNLVAVSAKWKNGKTFFCDILASIFLGSRVFGGCESIIKQGKVRFYDTEQARNDTARILKTIRAMTPEERHDDIEVSCLRDASIYSDDPGDEISRYDFICRSIELEHPDLVIIDGVADLIMNYNEVAESQDIVTKLAALANKHNCCIVVVMHQNKSMQDKMMKGHIGTMLYQKCSDVFMVEKHDTIFVVSHPVSRHRQSKGLAFKLDANAIPQDAVADRRLQKEMKALAEQRRKEAETREKFAAFFPEDGSPILKKDLVDAMMKENGLKSAICYRSISNAIKQGVIEEQGRHYLVLKPDCEIRQEPDLEVNQETEQEINWEEGQEPDQEN